MTEERRSGHDRRRKPRRAADLNKVQRLHKLIEASSALATVESVEELLPKLLSMAQEVTYAQASSIMLYDPERDVLQFSLALNESKEGILETLKQNIELKMGEGIAGWVAAEREPVRIDDASTDERFYRGADKTTGFTTKAVLCAPIVHNEELLGVVQVLNPKERAIFDDEDLELLKSFGHLASVALIRRRLLESRLREERLQVQLSAASDIQQNLLPSERVDERDFIIWGDSKPAIFVGGDLFDYFGLDDGTWLAVLADVSGKGLPAALIMSALWARIRSVAKPGLSPAALLSALNSDVLWVMGGGMFATLVATVYDPGTGSAQIALAGHLPPLKFSAGRLEEISGIKGMPLGIDESATFENVGVEIEPDESLVFVSDGVTEARRQDGAFFEMEGVSRFAGASGNGPRGAALIEAVDAFRAGAAANDDTTVVEIYRKGR
jgi:serine phosphatase RsbU (regulator of sigma subunit)